EKINASVDDKTLIEKLQQEKKNLEKELKDLQVKYNELLSQEKNNLLKEKAQELGKLKKKFISKRKDATEDLLEAENELASCDVSSDRHIHEKIKEKNINRLKESGFKEKDINELCQLQNEITRLRLELEGMKEKSKLVIEG